MSGTLSEDFVIPELLEAMQALGPAARAGDIAVVAALRRHEPRDRPLGWLALAAPGLEPFAPDVARDLARLANDRLAVVVRRSKGRLSGFATLAASDSDAVEEARRARRLGLAGIAIGANRGWPLSHPNVRAILDYAAATATPVYLPASFAPLAGDAPYRAEGAAGILAGASSDSAGHAKKLIFGGLLEAAPGVQIILARLGDATPYWWGRFHDLQADQRRTSSTNTVAHHFARSLLLTSADMGANTRQFCDVVLGPARVLAAAGRAA